MKTRRNFMNKRWLVILLGILGIVMVYELLNNSFSVFMTGMGIIALLVRSQVDDSKQNILLLVGVGALIFALLTSRVALLFLVVVLMLFIGEFPQLFQTLREALTNKKNSGQEKEFVMVQFNQRGQNTPRIVRNRWIGNDSETTNAIYSWDDLNFTKFIGDTVFDLGNTILPKAQNIIMIRHGFGNVKILVPKEVSISLDISLLLGELKIDQEEIDLRNETFKWRSERYDTNPRKIKLVANVLVGEVEVIFL